MTGSMRAWSDSFADGSAIPARYALARIADDPADHATLSDNINPHVGWADLPDGTRSVAVMVIDVSAPSSAEDVNKDNREVPADLPRADFSHWLVVDLDPAPGGIAEGSHSDGVVPGGKPGLRGPGGVRQGRNDYTSWFLGDPVMEGIYHGYDGPGPPWNDALAHRYVFTVYALDVQRLPLPEDFDAPTLREALAGHVLAEASFSGTYTTNPRLAG